MGNTVLGSLTPQVVRVAVDSILGGEDFPNIVKKFAPDALLTAAPMTQLFALGGSALGTVYLWKPYGYIKGIRELCQVTA